MPDQNLEKLFYPACVSEGFSHQQEADNHHVSKWFVYGTDVKSGKFWYGSLTDGN